MDLEQLKRKLKEIKREPKEVNPHLFRPAEGEQIIRIVPNLRNKSNPFEELYFHYNIGGKTILSPLSYGQRDPLAEFSNQEIANGKGKLSKEEFKEAKKFYPQMRTYAPIVIRGKEAEGVKWWGFGKTTFTTLIEIIQEEDYGSIEDVVNGNDLKLTFTPANKSATGFASTKIVARPRKTTLTDDKVLLDKLLNNQPSLLDDIFSERVSYEDLVKLLHSQGQSQSGTEVDNSDDWNTSAATSQAATQKVDTDFNNLFES